MTRESAHLQPHFSAPNARDRAKERAAFLLMVAVMSTFIAPMAAAFSDLSGNPCTNMGLVPGAWNYHQHARDRISSIKDNYRNHLAPAIRAMRTEGGTGHGGSVSANLHFTLVRIPNHPQALAALVDYFFVIKDRPKHEPLKSQPECYLQQAIAFAPNDITAYKLFGIYLFRRGEYELAIDEFDKALGVNSESAESYYNKALALTRLDRLEEARTVGKKAYELGHPLPGLRNILKRKGVPITEVSSKD